LGIDFDEMSKRPRLPAPHSPSTSATLVVDGKVEATPIQIKNDSIDVCIGFYR
jgi:hypothetical protein